MPVFDPNAAMPDFERQNASAAQQRALANALRKQALESQQPQGQMVSGHYVAPSWAEQLQGIMKGVNSAWQDNIATGAETDASNAQNQAASQWRSSLPQAIQAQAGTPSVGANEMDQEAVAGSPAVPYQPVPTAARLKATLEGMRNPSTREEAKLWNAGMAEEATREDTQAARKDTLQATLQGRREELSAKLEQQEKDAIRRSEDQRYSADQRRDAAAEAANVRREIAAMAAATSRGNAELRASAGQGGGGSKPVPQTVMKTLTELQDRSDALDDSVNTYKPEFAGMSGAISKNAGQYIPGVNSDSANWWKTYSKNAELTERHALFGAALTGPELTSWKNATISPGMTDKVIKENLAIRAKLAKKLYDKGVINQHNASAGAYNVTDAFQPKDPASASQLKQFGGGAPTAPAGKGELTPAESAELAALKARLGK